MEIFRGISSPSSLYGNFGRFERISRELAMRHVVTLRLLAIWVLYDGSRQVAAKISSLLNPGWHIYGKQLGVKGNEFGRGGGLRIDLPVVWPGARAVWNKALDQQHQINRHCHFRIRVDSDCQQDPRARRIKKFRSTIWLWSSEESIEVRTVISYSYRLEEPILDA